MKPIDRLDHQEYSEGDDQEIDDVIKKRGPVGKTPSTATGEPMYLASISSIPFTGMVTMVHDPARFNTVFLRRESLTATGAHEIRPRHATHESPLAHKAGRSHIFLRGRKYDVIFVNWSFSPEIDVHQQIFSVGMHMVANIEFQKISMGAGG